MDKDDSKLERRIEVVTMRVRDLKNNFENPRKINKGKSKELRESLEELGNFGVIVIDENDNIIAGTQRAKQLSDMNPDQEVLCKKLIGYSEMERKKINIKDNTHAGEWDLNMLALWTADLGMEVDVEPKGTIEDRKIDNMELIRFEKYDYLLVAFRTEMEYTMMKEKLGLLNKRIDINGKRNLKARAVWFEQLAKILK